MTTNTSGNFTITGEKSSETDSLKVIKDGCARYQKPLCNYSGEDITVNLYLKPVDVIVTIDPASEAGNMIRTYDEW